MLTHTLVYYITVCNIIVYIMIIIMDMYIFIVLLLLLLLVLLLLLLLFWAVTFIPMPMPKRVCRALSWNEWVQYKVSINNFGRSMGMNVTAQILRRLRDQCAIFVLNTFVLKIPGSLGAKYCTPEINTSEIIVEFQWHFPMAVQWHVPTTCHFVQWYCRKDCNLFPV